MKLFRDSRVLWKYKFFKWMEATLSACDFSKETEFENAIALYGGIITKICYYFSTDPDDFNDLRQEVLYNLWRGWDTFRHDSKISTWIYRVCFNTCVSYQRKENKSRQTLSIEAVVNVAAPSDEKLLDKYNRMHALIRKLNYQERAIILMWLDEKTYDEIAELMGLNRNTLAVKLKRIKEKLIKLSKKWKKRLLKI